MDKARLERQELKVFGEHASVVRPVDSFVRLPQVRNVVNPELESIKESIRVRGLINPIDVAHLTQGQLEEYIGFVNRIWKTNASIDDYDMQQEADGTYYAVVAGYTRHKACQMLQDEWRERGIGEEINLFAKVHEVTSPEDIIALQLDENLHAQPPKEQQAIAVVESYRIGLENGQWATKKDFIEQHAGKISRGRLDEALFFADLPEAIRDYVLGGNLPYNIAVELGRAGSTIRSYSLLKLGYLDNSEKFDESQAEIAEQAYRTKLDIMLNHVNKLSGVKKRRAYITGQVRQMSQAIETWRQDSQASPDPLFGLDIMMSTEEQARLYMAKLRQERSELKSLMARTNDEARHRLDRLSARLDGMASETALDDLTVRRQRLLGRAAGRQL